MDANLFGATPKQRTGPDPAELLARYMALRDVSRLVATFAGREISEADRAAPSEQVAVALEQANIWVLRQFSQHCSCISDFMMLGLSALQKAREHGAFNPYAAKRLYEEYKSSEAKALHIIGI